VVGSANVDLVAYADRLPARGETIRGQAFERFLGGKGVNQAVAAARAGAEALLVSAVGKDSFGDYVLAALRDAGVEISEIERTSASTGVAAITVGGGDNQIVVVPGANDLIDVRRMRGLAFAAGDVCVAQLETAPAVVEAAFEQARSRGALTLFNPAPAVAEAKSLFPLADVLVVNETECASFTGAPFDLSDAAQAIRDAAKKLGLGPNQTFVVTVGEQGVRALSRGRAISIAGHRVAAVDTTGAGDCFCGTLAAALGRGEAIEAALSEANAAAALSVTKKGAAASMPARAEVLAFLKSGA
jgi:ribokinase